MKKIGGVLDDRGGAGRLLFIAERGRKVRKDCERRGQVTNGGDDVIVGVVRWHGEEMREPRNSVGDTSRGGRSDPNVKAAVVLECRPEIKTRHSVRGP